MENNYISEMRDCGLIITNPLRGSRVIPYSPPPEFKYSKYLVELRSKLRNKFYTRRVFRNRLIKVLSIGIVGLGIIAISLYITLLLYSKGWIPSSAGSWIGLNIAMVIIVVGLYMDMWFMDHLPTNTFYIDINKRKRKLWKN